MYTEQDRTEIRQRIKKYIIITAAAAVVFLAAFVAFIWVRLQIPAIAAAALMYAAICFGWLMYIYPCIRYESFLKDVASGIGRSMEGTIIEVSGEEDLQDGVRVLPVRILLKKEQDERIVYLNASKKELFPAEGTEVRLNCFGRHIKEVLL